MTITIAMITILMAFQICTGFVVEGGDVVRFTPVGLVLSGGEAGGAYEIGVWKVLKESGIVSNITAISGTSVGALNAARELINLGYKDARKALVKGGR